MSLPTVFVVGATGAQGGAVARALLKSKKYAVNALVRDTTSEAAQSLVAQGASLTKGDWDDIPAIEKAAAGSVGLFLNSYPSFTDNAAELRQAQNILDAAKKAGIKHVIHSSAIGVDRYKELFKLEPGSFLENYFLSKSSIEQAVKTGGFESWNIFRGTYFDNNFLLPAAAFPYPELGKEGTIVSAVLPTTKYLLFDPENLGNFALAAFSDAGKFGNKDLNLAAELLVLEEIAKVMEKVSGKKVSVRFRSEEEIAALQGQNPFVESQVMLREMHTLMDLDESREWGVPLTTFEDFMKREEEVLMKTVGPHEAI